MLLLVSFLGLVLAGGVLGHPTPAFFLIVASFIIKAVAGGKRKAELTANEATKRADTEQLERTVLEARMEALQARSSRISCSIRWPASTSSSRPTRRARPGCSRA